MTANIPHHLTRMNRHERYPSLGRCIYCGTPLAEGPLTEEHIVAEMIGGTLVFDGASCNKCQDETHAFEGHACDVYRPVRRQLSFPSKVKGHKALKRNAEEKFILGVDYGRIKVPSKEFPALLMTLVYPLPRILFNLPVPPDDVPLTGGIGNIEVMPEFGERLNAIKRKYRTNKVSIVGVDKSKRMDDGDYGRMLAKIAHGYAMAELGEAAFKPYLVNAIRDIRPYNFTHFIGSQIATPEPAVDLHELTIEEGTPESRRHVIVRVRLFAPYKTPAHLVVVGARL